jgi:chromosome segregation ATPase
MEQTQTIGAGLTFEKVWAALMENREQIKATNEQMKAANEQLKEEREADSRRFKEQMEASDKQFKQFKEEREADSRRFKEQMEASDKQFKQFKEEREATERQMKATDKRIGELTNRFGDMVEYMVLPNLVTKFEELGFTFTKANRTEIKDKEHNIFLEADALLENGDKVMAVEIKTKPSIDDIHDHIERMEKLRQYADLHSDKRVYLGAVAGVVFSNSEKIYALKKGFYVIEPSGDTFNITEPKGNYHPHEW